VVVTKIAKVGNAGNTLKKDITRYTNTQTAVRSRDLLALIDIFDKWSDQMATQFGVFLEVQRGAWDNQRVYQRQNPTTRQYREVALAANLLKVYGAGWLGEAGTAFGKNDPFLPSGRIYQQIIASAEDDDSFGISDLYAAHRLWKVADDLRFGRMAMPQRRLTRYLFFMTVIELLKKILLQMTIDPEPKQYTRSLLKLWERGNEDAANVFISAAASVLDRYMSEGDHNSIYAEPEFQKRFSGNLNSFLKWEGLGKNDQTSPKYRMQVDIANAALAINKQQYDLIATAVRS